MEGIGGSLFEHIRIISDPRAEKNKRHSVEAIVFIAICAVICGAESWVDLQRYGELKKEWLSKHVDLSRGIPSHDTFGRFFALLNPKEFQEGFLGWIRRIEDKTQGRIVSLDGKSIRRSHDRSNGKEALHLVHAWASENHMLLGENKTDAKSNEITAIPELLKLLDLEGAIVTVDAMGTQKEIAGKIQGQKGDYVMALKGNHGVFHEEARQYWKDPELRKEADYYETTEKGHGRLEQRRHWSTEDLSWFADKAKWPGLKSFACVESERTVQGQTSLERRYYLSSLKADAQELARSVRAHWSVENNLHWVLDVVFREDESRVRIGHAAENFALLRRMALSLLKKDKTSKDSLKGKRFSAGLNDGFLEKILFHNDYA
jgi:predicted transposase YbfD/YdcC